MSCDEIKESVLVNPRVHQLIAALTKHPLDAPVIIEDADTGWKINMIHVKNENGLIVLYGEYPEMN